MIPSGQYHDLIYIKLLIRFISKVSWKRFFKCISLDNFLCPPPPSKTNTQSEMCWDIGKRKEEHRVWVPSDCPSASSYWERTGPPLERRWCAPQREVDGAADVFRPGTKENTTTIQTVQQRCHLPSFSFKYHSWKAGLWSVKFAAIADWKNYTQGFFKTGATVAVNSREGSQSSSSWYQILPKTIWAPMWAAKQ